MPVASILLCLRCAGVLYCLKGGKYMARFFYRIICGFFLGLSVFLPGLSGSVVAIIMGIYQDILRIVSNPFKKLKENIIYCVPLAIGVGISGILFIIVFNYLGSIRRNCHVNDTAKDSASGCCHFDNNVSALSKNKKIL